MNILESIDNILNETGLQNMKELAKNYKEAEIYFHIDTDGVCSGIGIREYLKRYGIKTVDVHKIQYGDQEYAIPFPKKGRIAVLVDFAHGKPVMKIHTDHHDNQVGAEFTKKSGATSFVKTPSNAAYISQTLSPSDIFPPKDIKIISTIDSADFASQNITPDDIMRAVYNLNPDLDIMKNHRAMGFAVNKLLLTYKNKEGFLENLVMHAKPSLVSMYNLIKKLAKEAGYKPPKDIEVGVKDYSKLQKDKILPSKKPADVKNLKNGESMLIGNTIIQYGGGNMFGGYDRYVPFKNFPYADYLCIAWSMGLIQISKNPFKSGKNLYNLADIGWKVMDKFKSKLNKMVDLSYIKWNFDKNIKEWGAMGFRITDLFALFKGKIKTKENVGSEGWKKLSEILKKPSKFIKKEEKEILKNVEISIWDIMKAQSGGHHDITNIQGFSFLGKGYTSTMKDIMMEIAKEMKDKRLEE